MVSPHAKETCRSQKKSRVTLLSVTATAPGRSFPVWKVFFNNRRSLRDVIRCWASAFLGTDINHEIPAHASARASEKTLDPESRIGSLRSVLPIRHGAYKLEITWPADALPEAAKASAKVEKMQQGARSKLRKLHPSARYCHVDRRVMGWGSSSTHKSKIQAGVYSQTRGHYPEAQLARAMRTPPLPKDGRVELRSRCLAAVDDNDKVLFEVKLSGPEELIHNWEAACQRYESFLEQRGHKLDKQALQVPHPVFIPSRGRPEKAHLNWEASHVFGPQEKETGLQPVVCIVVEPEEEEDYRETWPLALMLILPEGNRGPGYARWAVQTVCTRAHVTGGCSGPCQPATLRRLGRIWIVDDTLTTFYRLAWMDNFRQCGRLARPKRMKHRVASSELMFVEALLAVQRHPFVGRAAVAGFLRDDGTAVCKRAEWKLDELALYKVVLLDLNELRRLQVAYVPSLQMYEDICLNHDVLSRGGRTLKCQCYGFRAVHAKMGGCLQQRAGHRDAGKTTGITKLEDLIQPAAFAGMCHDRQKAIRELLRWVQDKETLFRKRSLQEPGQPSSSARKRKESSETFDRTDGRTGSGDVKVELPEAIIVSDDSDFEELKMTSANTDTAPLAWGLPSQRVLRKT
mmetsp:Transcript_64737/g.134167  ORF Transcript_64737/g.134167 Transcript_64737/m.134167 type:complete len:630 (-) Transcript_64737:124-2013(-)